MPKAADPSLETAAGLLPAKLSALHPAVLVCLGATAAQALLGKQFRVTQQRGQWIVSPLAPLVMATIHPSSILRAPNEETRRAKKLRFINDLKIIRSVL